MGHFQTRKNTSKQEKTPPNKKKNTSKQEKKHQQTRKTPFKQGVSSDQM
jgi:hypothetical protein